MKKRSLLSLVCFSLLLGCTAQKAIDISLEPVSAETLASSFVHTPDPRRKTPPLGQKLYISWWVPNKAVVEKPELLVDILFWNTTKKELRFDLTKRRIGYELFELIGKEFEQTGGILTYRARMVGNGGELIEEWRHQMWVDLIEIKGRQQPEIAALPSEEEVELSLLEDEADPGELL